MPVYVSFSAEIVPQTTEILIAALGEQANKGVDEVYLLLSTPGGSVMHGLTLYNTLRAFPFKLITHNVGNVESIGIAAFLAGEERYTCPHSTFMFHGVGFDLPQARRFEQKDLQEKLDSLLQDQLRIGKVIRDRTDLDEGQIADIFKEARTKDADYAKSVGMVHDIRDVQIPLGSPIISLVFQRQGI